MPIASSWTKRSHRGGLHAGASPAMQNGFEQNEPKVKLGVCLKRRRPSSGCSRGGGFVLCRIVGSTYLFSAGRCISPAVVALLSLFRFAGWLLPRLLLLFVTAPLPPLRTVVGRISTSTRRF